MYGTSRAAVARVADEGRVCVLDIDVQVRWGVTGGGSLARTRVMGHASDGHQDIPTNC
jgi:hypothetical protein